MTINAAFTHFPSLTTNRLLLRQIRPEDAEALFATFSDEEVMEFYGREPHQSLADSQELIRRIQAGYARSESIYWGITLHGEDRGIGSCSFHHFGPGFHRAETGYELTPPFWGQGLMFEAMSATLPFEIPELSCQRLEADNIDT